MYSFRSVHNRLRSVGRAAYVYVFIGFLFAPSLIAAPELIVPTDSESSVLFILDASGSMNEYLGIYQKIHLAKKYIRHYVDKLPEEAEAGFIAYGNRVPGCQSSRLYQPLEKGNKPQFRNKLFGLTPAGATPLAESIRIAGEYILRRKSPTELILVTDGIESCYGDPEKEIGLLRQKGIDFKMHVLGLGLKPEEKRVMESLAKSGKGNYYHVDGDSDFYNAVEDLLGKETRTVRPPKTSEGNFKARGKIRILNLEKAEGDSETNVFRLNFDFSDSDSKEHCVLLNLKRPESNSIRTKEWVPQRTSGPENVVRTEQTCFQSSEGKGTFVIRIPKQMELKAELELWDMTRIPQPVDTSGERKITD